MSKKVLVELDLTNSGHIEFMKQYASELFGDDMKKGKTKAKPEPEEEDDEEEEEGEITPDDVKEAWEELKKLTSVADVKEVVSDFGVKTPAAAAKHDDFEEIYEALMDAIEEAGGESDDDDEDEGEEITVDDVKKACQAFAKSEGKDELEEILEEFNIKSVRSLSKLTEDELAELYEEVAG